MPCYRPRPDLVRAYEAALCESERNPLFVETANYAGRGIRPSAGLVKRFGHFAVRKLWLGLADVAVDGSDWRPAAGGRTLITLPVFERRVFDLGAGEAPGVMYDVIDILALDPDTPPKFWFRTGQADLLAGLIEPRALRGDVKLYATPIGWINGYRLCVKRAIEAARLKMETALALTPSLPLPGVHGLCVVKPQQFDWYGRFAGKRLLRVDLPPFANALTTKLKAQRRQVTTTIAPKPRVGLGHG